MLIVTANIRNNQDMPNRDVVQDARTVAALSGQLVVKPATIDWLKENMWSPIHAIGR